MFSDLHEIMRNACEATERRVLARLPDPFPHELKVMMCQSNTLELVSAIKSYLSRNWSWEHGLTTVCPNDKKLTFALETHTNSYKVIVKSVTYTIEPCIKVSVKVGTRKLFKKSYQPCQNLRTPFDNRAIAAEVRAVIDEYEALLLWMAEVRNPTGPRVIDMTH
jgi:hypothetical protein